MLSSPEALQQGAVVPALGMNLGIVHKTEQLCIYRSSRMGHEGLTQVCEFLKATGTLPLSELCLTALHDYLTALHYCLTALHCYLITPTATAQC